MGIIQSSSIKQDTVTDDSGTTDIYYRPLIIYRYEINDKQYVVRDPVYEVLHYNNNIENAEQIVSEYPIGKTGDVFYNPEKPAESTLKPRFNKWHPLFYLIPIICLSIGAISFWLAFS